MSELDYERRAAIAMRGWIGWAALGVALFVGGYVMGWHAREIDKHPPEPKPVRVCYQIPLPPLESHDGRSETSLR